MSISEEYKTTKEKYANEILLFQAGIFYRIMFEDAGKISDVLGIKLRVEGDAERSPGGFQSGTFSRRIFPSSFTAWTMPLCLRHWAAG